MLILILKWIDKLLLYLKIKYYLGPTVVFYKYIFLSLNMIIFKIVNFRITLI